MIADQQLEDMSEVSKDEFFNLIGLLNLNVHPRIVGSFPYVSLFETPRREVLCKMTPRTDGRAGHHYWVARHVVVPSRT